MNLESLVESMFLGEVVDDLWRLPDETFDEQNREAITDHAFEYKAPIQA